MLLFSQVSLIHNGTWVKFSVLAKSGSKALHVTSRSHSPHRTRVRTGQYCTAPWNADAAAPSDYGFVYPHQSSDSCNWVDRYQKSLFSKFNYASADRLHRCRKLILWVTCLHSLTNFYRITLSDLRMTRARCPCPCNQICSRKTRLRHLNGQGAKSVLVAQQLNAFNISKKISKKRNRVPSTIQPTGNVLRLHS
jgi:hypothetical protein